MATYPERRLLEQVLRGTALVYLARRQLPEVLTLILRPKGHFRISGVASSQSPLGTCEWQARWRVVELWKLSADDLLATGDVGLVPWVPLAEFAGPPQPLLEECRRRIEEQGPPDERANLLAVTQVMTRLRYNDPRLLTILGGSRAMIESPLIQELMDQKAVETQRRDILRFLKSRFGPIPQELAASIEAIGDESALDELVDLAARCRTLNAFRKRLQQ